MPQNRIPLKSYNYRPQGRRSIERPKKFGESNYNPGDGTDQRVQSLVFMMMMMMMKYIKIFKGTPTCFDLNRSSSGSSPVPR